VCTEKHIQIFELIESRVGEGIWVAPMQPGKSSMSRLKGRRIDIAALLRSVTTLHRDSVPSD